MWQQLQGSSLIFSCGAQMLLLPLSIPSTLCRSDPATEGADLSWNKRLYLLGAQIFPALWHSSPWLCGPQTNMDESVPGSCTLQWQLGCLDRSVCIQLGLPSLCCVKNCHSCCQHIYHECKAKHTLGSGIVPSVWKGIKGMPKASFSYPHWLNTFLWNQLLWHLKHHRPHENLSISLSCQRKEMPCLRSNGKSAEWQRIEQSSRYHALGTISFGYLSLLPWTVWFL